MAVVVDPLRFNVIIASFKRRRYITCFILYHLVPEVPVNTIAYLLQPVCCRKYPHLEESKISSLQTQIDVDEADEDYIPLVQDNTKASPSLAPQDQIDEAEETEEEPIEERMSEEDLLKAMQDNMVDKKNNRRSY